MNILLKNLHSKKSLVMYQSHRNLFYVIICHILLTLSSTLGKEEGTISDSNNATIVNVKEGAVVYLNCYDAQFEDYHTNVTWVKLSNALVVSENVSVYEISNLIEFRAKFRSNVTEKYSVLHDEANVWTLAIQNVTQDDTGEYQCELDYNDGTFYHHLILVNILKPKTVMHGARPVYVGDRLVIGCNVENVAAPEYVQWYHNDNDIIFDNERLRLYPVQSSGNSGIEIHPVTEDDEGIYRCVPSNSHPAESYVSVIVDSEENNDRVSLSSPGFTGLQKTLIITLEGTRTELPCEQDVPPENNVIWTRFNEALTRNEITLIDKNRFEAYEKKDNGWVLSIRDVTENDATIYTCKVINRENVTRTSLVQLQVLTQTIEVFGKRNLMSDDTLKLTCFIRLVGTTRVYNIDWEHDGKLIDFGRNNTEVFFTKQKYYVESSLVIKGVKVSDSGQYVCIGSNMHIEPYVVEVKVHENKK